MYTEKLSISLVVDVGVLEGQLRAVQSVEVRVKQSHLGANSLVRVEGCHALEQIDLQLVQRWRVCLHGDASELREARFKVGQLQSIRPIVLVWSSEYLEDLKDLVDLRVACEQRLLLCHFREDAASTPEVNAQ